jgi:hypothetical protein
MFHIAKVQIIAQRLGGPTYRLYDERVRNELECNPYYDLSVDNMVALTDLTALHGARVGGRCLACGQPGHVAASCRNAAPGHTASACRAEQAQLHPEAPQHEHGGPTARPWQHCHDFNTQAGCRFAQQPGGCRYTHICTRCQTPAGVSDPKCRVCHGGQTH